MFLYLLRQQIKQSFGLFLKIVRLSTFGVAVLILFAIVTARSVYGSTAESVYDVERQWARRAGKLDADADTYRVQFNGQSMLIASHMTDLSVHDVLEAADKDCQAHSGGIGKDISKLPGVAFAKLTSAMFGVVRKEWDNRGFVACFARDDDRGFAGLAKDLPELVKTGDLSKFGALHYVIVERTPGSTKTYVRRQWTDGEFVLTKMFPAEGDAPGTDLAEVSRPEGSRRILDASVSGSNFGVRVYEAPGAPEANLAAYDRDLPTKGWTSVQLPENKNAPMMRVYDQGPTDLFISAAQAEGKTVISIASVPPN